MSQRFRQERERQKQIAAAKRDPLSVHFDIESWLKDRNRLVTRGELYDFITRLEVGKRMRNRTASRLRRLGRRIWGWLTFRPIDVEDPIYRPGFPTSPPKESAWKPATPDDVSASSPAASSLPTSPTPSAMPSSQPSALPSPVPPATGSAS